MKESREKVVLLVAIFLLFKAVFHVAKAVLLLCIEVAKWIEKTIKNGK